MATKDAVKERTDHKIKEPRLYQVIMLNDDFTAMDFVVAVLTDIFHKDEESATQLMLTVHHSGKAVIGKYPYDIAVTRTNKAMAWAKEAGYPFRMTVEEE